MKPNEKMFPRTIKEIEAYVGTNTTRNVAGLISHLETELLQYKADLRATDEQVAQLEAELGDFRDRRDEKFQMYEDCKAEYALLKAKLAAIECAGCGKTMLTCACDD